MTHSKPDPQKPEGRKSSRLRRAASRLRLPAPRASLARIGLAATRAFRMLLGITRSQSGRRLLMATPILLVGLSLPFAVSSLRGDPSELRSRYEQLAMRAMAEDDTETAAVCLDRLIRLKAESKFNNPRFAFQLASLAGELGQAERAEVLLDEVAPHDRPVHAPAHHARARRLLAAPEVTRDHVTLAERHLRFALELQPDLVAAHETAGLVALQTGDWARARTHLERAARENPALTYLVAVVLRQQGLAEPATEWARMARDHFRQVAEKQPEAHEARLVWAASELLLEDFAQARVALQQGLARADLAEYHQMLSNAYLAEALALQRSGEGDLGRRLVLLERGLRHNPDNSGLVSLASEILKENDSDAEVLREKLHELMAEGKAVATVHLILGFDAWGRGRVEQARLHWERASDAAPGSAIIANNLAWSLATGPEPDLPRALDLVELALDQAPGEPNLLGTRGRILARLGRPRDALADLEAALKANADNPDLHSDLADTYAALDVPELAQTHRRRAEELGGPSASVE